MLRGEINPQIQVQTSIGLEGQAARSACAQEAGHSAQTGNISQVDIQCKLILEAGCEVQIDLQGVAVQREIDQRAVRGQAQGALDRQIDVLHRIGRITLERLELHGKLIGIVQEVADALVHERQLALQEGKLLELGEVIRHLDESIDDLGKAQILEI